MKRYISKTSLIFPDEWLVNNDNTFQLITVIGKRNILTLLYYNDGIDYCTSLAFNEIFNEILNALYTGMNRYELFV